jgi:hypothetical protein
MGMMGVSGGGGAKRSSEPTSSGGQLRPWLALGTTTEEEGEDSWGGGAGAGGRTPTPGDFDDEEFVNELNVKPMSNETECDQDVYNLSISD